MVDIFGGGRCFGDKGQGPDCVSPVGSRASQDILSILSAPYSGSLPAEALQSGLEVLRCRAAARNLDKCWRCLSGLGVCEHPSEHP